MNYSNSPTCAEIDYPHRDCSTSCLQELMLRKIFTGKGWWNRFFERWLKICLRNGDALAIPHAQVQRKKEQEAKKLQREKEKWRKAGERLKEDAKQKRVRRARTGQAKS